jgi:VWFA-related protein
VVTGIREQSLVTRSDGQTALLDAIRMAIDQLHGRTNPRRAIVIFSDGGENSSRVTVRGLLGVLDELDARLYAVNFPDAGARWASPAEEVVEGPDLLDELCARAGGRYFAVHDREELDRVADRVGKELRAQYVLGYLPSQLEHDGRRHRIDLNVRPRAEGEKLTVFWRRAYRAPAM